MDAVESESFRGRSKKSDIGDEADMGEDPENGFTLEEVLRLGGTKQDFIMLAGLDEGEEIIDGDKKGEIDDLEEGELQAFVEKLGIKKLAADCFGQENSAKQKEKIQADGIKKLSADCIGQENSAKQKEKMQAETSNVNKSKKKIDATDKDLKKKTKTKTNVVQQNYADSSKATSKIKGKAVFEFNERTILLIKPGGKWFDHEYTNDFTMQPQNEDDVSKYKSLAEKLYENERNLYKNKKELQKGANSSWMKTVVSTGTLGDRMAAMTVLIQDAPVHTLQFVENLVSLVRKKGSKQQNLMALDTIKDLLLSDLLPENRKLHTFLQHPFDKLEEACSGNRDARDRHLILWFFEEQLKKQVAEFVKVLSTLSHDNLDTTKAKSLNVAHELLCNKPEEEKSLLVLIVNKLGDPQYKIATKASYLLETLLSKHPNMKTVVCLEIERLLFRPNISEKAQYYGVCFLNQIIFSHEESDLANQLITVYFCFFRACVKKKDLDSKILRALLTGVNRAYPYAQIGNEKVKEQLDTLFKILHVVNFNTAVQVLMLLFQVMDSQQTVSNRYYGALYRKLLDPGLSQASKQAMFLNLIYKSMKADVVLRRVKAFVKRLLQVSCCQKPSFICGTLYLVSEVIRMKPGLKILLQENGENDDEECFHDLSDDDDDTCSDGQEKIQSTADGKISESKSSSASWVHQETLRGIKNSSNYDPFNRNPLFCGADNTSLWELKKLSEHFHPSVALFANNILEGNPIQYTGDPLQDFTLIRFLDRFVYRNPKAPKATENNRGYLMHRRKKLYMNEEKLPVNSPAFLEKKETDVPVHEVFFHRYFTKLSKDRKKIKRSEDEESLEDVDDEEFDKIIDSFEGDSFYSGPTDDIDFAGNLKADGKTEKKRSEADDSDDSDWDIDGEDDDEEISLGSMCEEDFENINDDGDENGGIFMDTENDEIPGKKTGKKKSLKQTHKDTFASAEEFGDILDENTGSKFDNIGLNAMANRDNASTKQLKWEAERDNWVHNKDIKNILKRKRKFSKQKLHKKVKK